MKKILVTAYPYATQSGTINVPDSLPTEKEIQDYVREHWDDIEFSEPDLDYCGTDFDTYADED